MTDLIWERRDCVSAELEDSIVLLDLDSLVYHSLNSTAAAVWEILAEPHDTASIVASLCSRYQVDPQQCRASIDKLLGALEAKGLVASKSPAGAVAG